MKSEDLLKAIGEIDEKYIEEASAKIKTSNGNLGTVLEEMEEHSTIKLSEAKSKNMLRIVASIAACLCLVTVVSFAVVSLYKQKINSGSDVSIPSAEFEGKMESRKMDGDSSRYVIGGTYEESGFEASENVNSMISEESKKETSISPQISEPVESSEVVSSNTESSDSENSVNSEETSNNPDTYPDNITTVSAKISSSDVKAITAGMTYQEIINQLGESANFGHFGLRQYIVDNEFILVLRFEKLTDVCTKTGDELLEEAVPYKVPERVLDKLNEENTVYGIVIDDMFISCIESKDYDSCSLSLKDAAIQTIQFENGESATVDDIKLMSGVIVTYDVVAESYPPQMNCTKVIILDDNQ